MMPVIPNFGHRYGSFNQKKTVHMDQTILKLLLGHNIVKMSKNSKYPHYLYKSKHGISFIFMVRNDLYLNTNLISIIDLVKRQYKRNNGCLEGTSWLVRVVSKVNNEYLCFTLDHSFIYKKGQSSSSIAQFIDERLNKIHNRTYDISAVQSIKFDIMSCTK